MQGEVFDMKRHSDEDLKNTAQNFLKKPGSKNEFIKQIVKAMTSLQKNTQDWKAGWRPIRNGFLPFNPYTRRYYRGFNSIWLLSVRLMCGYDDNRWLTFAQMKALEKNIGRKLHLRKGEEGAQIIVPYFEDYEGTHAYKRNRVLDDDKVTDSEFYDDCPDGYFIASIFNAAQIEGMPPWDDGGEMTEISRNKLLENFIASSAIPVRHGQCREGPAYNIRLDRIFMPYPGRFKSKDEYYAAKLHEFYHATGHWTREGRFDAGVIRKTDYAIEEVRAEFFSVAAGYLLGLPTCDANAASYIAGYQRRIQRGGPSLLTLAAQAGRILVTLGEYIAGLEPSAKWFPAKKKWKELIKAQKMLDEGLPGF